ncbi:MAG TPA: 4-(cytidine 5'-diphospho)-2-C-methyl-D-erythritol kinase [Frankiaceae bacterium]|nr:4-(cytidine 5'-diphospho)-2-C-methyl-D-erythritol kinase [Frankiaceae bacterium]
MTSDVPPGRPADSGAAAVLVRVPGKVNLHLGVGPLAPDGYHPVITVLQAVSIYDEVSASPAEEISVAVSGEGASAGPDGVPLGPDNLAHRAAAMLARRAGISQGVHLTLHKDIPVAAGMAGGSADAAAALVACNALWRTAARRDELHEVAADLGSDVPFALVGGTALGTGRGDQLTPVLARGSYCWVFALAERGLSTPAVYREYDRMLEELPSSPELLRPAVVARPNDVLAALRSGDAAALGAALGNDLQLPALRLRPELREVVQAGTDLGAIGGLVSGSGPTCAFLAADEAAAQDLAAGLTERGICRVVRTATGPVPGATVVEPG